MWQESAKSLIAVLVNRISGEEFNICRYANSIGRDIRNDLLFVADKTMSRQHASIQFVDGKYYLQDLGSKNGSRINGEKIAERMELKSGDEITLGLTSLIFVLVPSGMLNMKLKGVDTETLAESKRMVSVR